MKFVNSKSFSVALGVVIALSLTACGSSSTTEESTTSPAQSSPMAETTPATANTEATATEATATETTATEETAASNDIVARYVFTNTGSVEICELYLSQTDQDEWGPDQLKDQTIPAGEKFTLTDIPAGTYDAKAVGCNGAGEITVKLNITN